MKADKLTMTLLFDLYGELLTGKQRDCFDLHYNQDYSLSEIAEEMGTTRQGVHDAVSRAEAQLLRMEEVAHCLAQTRRTEQAVRQIRRLTETLRQTATEAQAALADQIDRTLETLL